MQVLALNMLFISNVVLHAVLHLHPMHAWEIANSQMIRGFELDALLLRGPFDDHAAFLAPRTNAMLIADFCM
jgi:hypothetical protein